MNQSLPKAALDQLFNSARTHHSWMNKPLADETLQELYDLAKWGPTAINANPMRILFVKSKEAKEKLYPTLMGSNVEQVRMAPVTAIIAYDHKFFDHLPTLFPAFDAKSLYQGNPQLTHETAFRNGSLQGGYFMIAARALGLDVGPMSGFDNAKVDEAFFAGTAWKSNFLCNIGYGDHAQVYPRGPRLEFKDSCKIV